MFKKRKHSFKPRGNSPHLYGNVVTTVKTETGDVVDVSFKKLDESVCPVLPSVSTFSLENHLKSGTPLTHVNSNLLDPHDPANSPVYEAMAETALNSVEQPVETPNNE